MNIFIQHQYRRDFQRQQAVLTAIGCNSGVAFLESILRAATNFYLFTPELHLMNRFTLADFCSMVPEFYCECWGIDKRVAKLPCDAEVDQEILLLSDVDTKRLAQKACSMYQSTYNDCLLRGLQWQLYRVGKGKSLQDIPADTCLAWAKEFVTSSDCDIDSFIYDKCRLWYLERLKNPKE